MAWYNYNYCNNCKNNKICFRRNNSEINACEYYNENELVSEIIKESEPSDKFILGSIRFKGGYWRALDCIADSVLLISHTPIMDGRSKLLVTSTFNEDSFANSKLRKVLNTTFLDNLGKECLLTHKRFSSSKGADEDFIRLLDVTGYVYYYKKKALPYEPYFKFKWWLTGKDDEPMYAEYDKGIYTAEKEDKDMELVIVPTIVMQKDIYRRLDIKRNFEMKIVVDGDEDKKF